MKSTHLTSRVQTTLGTYVNSYAYGKIIQASVAGVNDSPEDLFYQGAGALLRKSPREASAIYEMALVEKKGVETDDALAPIVLGAAVAAHAEGKEDLASQHLHQVLMASPTLKAALLVRSKKQSTQPFSPIAFLYELMTTDPDELFNLLQSSIKEEADAPETLPIENRI